MCGIVGYIATSEYKDTLEDKLEEIRHRGPDGNGVYEDYTNNLNVGLGHARLSIIDLSNKASQPFFSTCKRYVIVFNGEIYNYKALRDKYLNKSNLRTNSDTEVLLNLFILKGKEILNELNGMFTFVIYDIKEQSSFIARDQLGIKPLYYTLDENKFIFSSEIKALWKFKEVKKEIDQDLYLEFLLNGFIYEPDTGFVGINKLMPGSYITINKKFEVEQKRYWRLKSKELSINDEVTFFDNQINKSVKEHLESDVPVGLFFSGGVDSTIILNQVKHKIKPIIVKSSEEDSKESGQSNDYYYARKITAFLDVDLESITLSENIKTNEDFLEQIDFLSKATEEPISDYTFISSRAISKKSKDLGYTVMLSGMGADEIFGGYPRYIMVRYENFFRVVNKLVPNFLLKNKSFEKKLQRFRNYFNEKDFALKYASLVGYFSSKELNDLLLKNTPKTRYLEKTNNLLKDIPKATSLKKAMYLDMHGFLSHNFAVADKSSMLESLELRVPLATKDLIERTFAIKTNSLLKLRDTKVILKRILIKARFPKSIIYRKKAGFNPPLDNLIRNLGKEKISSVLKNNNFYSQFCSKTINVILSNHFNNKENNTYKIFQLLYFSYWIKNNQ